jgi:hypothetical protein
MDLSSLWPYAEVGVNCFSAGLLVTQPNFSMTMKKIAPFYGQTCNNLVSPEFYMLALIYLHWPVKTFW